MHITTGKFVEVSVWGWVFKRNSNTPGLVIAYTLNKSIDLPGNKIDSKAFCETYERICNLTLYGQDIDEMRWSHSVEITPRPMKNRVDSEMLVGKNPMRGVFANPAFLERLAARSRISSEIEISFDSFLILRQWKTYRM